MSTKPHRLSPEQLSLLVEARQQLEGQDAAKQFLICSSIQETGLKRYGVDQWRKLPSEGRALISGLKDKVCDRLEGHLTFASWLKVSLDIEGHSDLARRLTVDQIRAARLAWMDKMIFEGEI